VSASNGVEALANATHNRVLDNISNDKALVRGKSGIIRMDNVVAIGRPPTQVTLTVGNFPSSLSKIPVHPFYRNECVIEQSPAHDDPNGLSPAEARRTALYLTLHQVPEGKVVSYGQLAELAGLGRAARFVGRTLSQLPHGSSLPWHRVLGAGGRISLAPGTPSGEEQRARLRTEGVTIRNNRVDMVRHGWRPMEHNG
jgi:methylated-DNA-protein-cysteine methyltransferase-like protein